MIDDISPLSQQTPSLYFLGVDGGGSSTRAVIVNEQGEPCGYGQAGSANAKGVGTSEALHNISYAVEQAAAMAHCQLPLHKAWLGIGGVDRPEDAPPLTPHLSILARQIHLTNDVDLILGALEEQIGIALIAGTGSIALGRDPQGNTMRAGGWGHILGDEGSGYDLGRQGLQAVARASDGRGPQTLLSELFLAHWQLKSPEDLLHKVYTLQGKAEIARLSTLVLNAARQHDLVALTITQQAASELAMLVHTIWTRLRFSDHTLPLALSGGVLLHEEFFRDLVLKELESSHTIRPLVLVDQPALSAARAALKLA